VADILDNVPIHLACPTEGCPGEIKTTFGQLKANPEVICYRCNIKTEAVFTEEELEAARAAMAQAGGARPDSISDD
jgi:hypothetical protein